MSNRAGNNYNRILSELYNRYYKQILLGIQESQPFPGNLQDSEKQKLKMAIVMHKEADLGIISAEDIVIAVGKRRKF